MRAALVCGAMVLAGCNLYFGDGGGANDAGVLCFCDARVPDARPPADAYVPVCRDAAPPADAGVWPDAGPPSDANPGEPQTGCGVGEGCYVNIFELSSLCASEHCDDENLCGHGEACGFLNACHPGKSCAVLNDAQDGLLCAKLCDASFAEGLTTADLPLAPDPIQNGVGPWSCGRDDDGPGGQDTALAYPRYVCIPLGGDGDVRYWADLTSMDGWPYGARVGVCIDTEADGNPYAWSPMARPRPTRPSQPRPIAHDLTCNPVTQVGCGPNEKCGLRVIEAGNPPLAYFKCGPDGTRPAGETCTIDGQVACGMLGTSDCVAGTECVDGVCKQLCDPYANNCPSGYCEPGTNTLGTENVGVCRDSCDPVGVAGP